MKSKITFAVAVGLAFAGTSASAITITNPSFEDGNTGWTQVGGGIKTPPSGGDNIAPAPEGTKVYFAWGPHMTVSQILGDALLANTTYTLQMDFVGRTDNEGPIDSFLAFGYGAGGPGSGELKRIVSNNPDAPTDIKDGYKTWTLTHETGESPTGEGQALWIQLGSRSNSSGSAGYDNIRLVAVTVPEPSTTALLGLGGLALILRRRK